MEKLRKEKDENAAAVLEAEGRQRAEIEQLHVKHALERAEFERKAKEVSYFIQ